MTKLLAIKGTVRIKLIFKRWQNLNRIIPGKIDIRQYNDSITIYRELPGMQKSNLASKSQNAVFHYTKELFKGKYLTFSINLEDQYWKFAKNNCSHSSILECRWEIPIATTMQSDKQQLLFAKVLKKSK